MFERLRALVRRDPSFAKLLVSLAVLAAALAAWQYLKPGIGAPCRQNADCRSDLCFETNSFGIAQGWYCSERCVRDSDCPTGFRCKAATGVTKLKLGGQTEHEAYACQR